METLTKAFAVALTAVLTVLLIKKDNPSGALLIGISASAALFFAAVKMLEQITDFFAYTARYAGISTAILEPAVKCTGIAVISKFGGDFCRDAGQSAVAGALEFVGSAAALYCALPLMQSVMQLLESVL